MSSKRLAAARSCKLVWSCSVTCPSWNPCKSTREEPPSSFVEEAFRRGLVDNISVLVLDLRRALGRLCVLGALVRARLKRARPVQVLAEGFWDVHASVLI